MLSPRANRFEVALAMGSLQIRKSRSRKATRQYWYSLGGWILAVIGIGTCVVLALGWYPAESAETRPAGTVVKKWAEEHAPKLCLVVSRALRVSAVVGTAQPARTLQ